MYEMQVKVKNDAGLYEWISVRCTGAKLPYRFETKREAWDSLRKCYPDSMIGFKEGVRRVIKAEESAGANE